MYCHIIRAGEDADLHNVNAPTLQVGCMAAYIDHSANR